MTDVKMGAETPRPIFAPKRTAEEKLFVYSYQCKKCGVQFHEELLENEKHVPTNIQPSQFCDIYIAPHYGVAECEVELVVK